MIEAEIYTPAMHDEWNSFVARARNATFLFDRRYMDYHADRFTDHSIVFRRKGHLAALLPLNIDGDTVWSHQGLTYGGLLIDNKACVEDVLQMFALANNLLRESGVRRVVYKAIPWIYHLLPSEEDLYAITWQCKARLLSRDISSTIDLTARPRFAESRKSGVRKALAAGIAIEESSDIDAFWRVLEQNLGLRYNAHPVHTASEMKLLMSRFQIGRASCRERV